MYKYFNPNPKGSYVGDCVIRALCKVFDLSWDEVYLDLMVIGFFIKDMPSANSILNIYLLRNGFRRFTLPDTCPDCYTVKDFCNDYRDGTYVLATGSHAIAVVDGDYYDSWNSGNEIPVFAYKKAM